MTRDSSARYAIPTADEWYKAGHYVGGGFYSTYPTGQNTANNNLFPGDFATMNHGGTAPYPVGSFPAVSPVGAYDMGGNVAE